MSIEKYLKHIESFKGKKVLVTGSTAGIGLELVKQLLYKEADVVLLARNIEKTNKIIDELKKTHPSSHIEMIRYDQSDVSFIEKCVQEIKEKHSDFYALVANAGILYPNKYAISNKGHPLTIATNYLGLKYFLDNLIPLFKNKRYIIQGSLTAGFHVSKRVDIYNDHYSLFKQYNTSKACVEALWNHYYQTNEDNEFILVEPGITSSDILRGFKQPIRSIGSFAVKISSHPVNQASLTALLGLTSSSKNGDFIVPRGILTILGYPKYKKFPKSRQREFLINNTIN